MKQFLSFARDLTLAIIVGAITGGIILALLRFLGLVPTGFGRLVWFLPGLVPLIFIAGLMLGHFLSRWWPVFQNFARFVVIGFNNAAIDFGILNLLIFTTNITQGFYFSVFKTVAFFAALINSYIWNKYWTFEAGTSAGGTKEVTSFVIVVGISWLINVGISSLLVNLIMPPGHIDPKLWANIASALAVAIGLFWNFIGMRVLVFRQTKIHVPRSNI